METRRVLWRRHLMGNEQAIAHKRKLYQHYVVPKTQINERTRGFIQRDIPRTYPQVQWVQENTESIKTLLIQYAVVHRADGYLQGFNYAMAIIYHVFYGHEHALADTWWCFARWVGLVRPFIPDFNVTWFHACRRTWLEKLMYRLKKKRPQLHSILMQEAETFSNLISCKWFLIWFAQQIDFEHIFVLWDVLILHPPSMVIKICTSIMVEIMIEAAPQITYQWSQNPREFMYTLLRMHISNPEVIAKRVNNSI